LGKTNPIGSICTALRPRRSRPRNYWKGSDHRARITVRCQNCFLVNESLALSDPSSAATTRWRACDGITLKIGDHPGGIAISGLRHLSGRTTEPWHPDGRLGWPASDSAVISGAPSAQLLCRGECFGRHGGRGTSVGPASKILSGMVGDEARVRPTRRGAASKGHDDLPRMRGIAA
jgi:hypothetical protein